MFPDDSGAPNLDVVRYYDRVINETIKAGLHPVAILYQFELPQHIQDNGGWTNPNIADNFTTYADLCFKTYGDRVNDLTAGQLLAFRF